MALQIMRFDPGVQASDSTHFEGIIAPDKGISAELLKVANSSYYGRSGKIKNLKDAVTLLGIKASKNLVILMITRNLKTHLKGPTYQRYLNEFPVVAALLAGDLARFLELHHIVEESFVSALLHRIGMTILALNRTEHYELILQQCEKNGWGLMKMEQGAYKTTHNSVTQEAFATWNLPEAMQNVAKNLDFPLDSVAQQTDLTRVTELSDIIASKLLSIDISEGAMEKEMKIVDHYGRGVDFTYKFDPAYYEKLKQHPFYRQAMSI
ncbi:MAG: HDOD domain-containing protein [Spirochaetia bacterium]|nr:HDOD domain-containing protein [Spirochaetia bacterium]